MARRETQQEPIISMSPSAFGQELLGSSQSAEFRAHDGLHQSREIFIYGAPASVLLLWPTGTDRNSSHHWGLHSPQPWASAPSSRAHRAISIQIIGIQGTICIAQRGNTNGDMLCNTLAA